MQTEGQGVKYKLGPARAGGGGGGGLIRYLTFETETAKKFNEFFAETDPSLAGKIPTPIKSFESFLKKASTTLPERCRLTINE